ncbi:hypothetical protein PENTCL1PPCAC_16149, partial [Pristionchus entomophagus]
MCVVAWFCTAVIPLLFLFLDCQFVYDYTFNLYYNKCLNIYSPHLQFLLDCLIYCSYAVSLIVLLIYVRIFIGAKPLQRWANSSISKTREAKMQLKLLKQSAFIFVIYAGSIMCVLVFSFFDPGRRGFYEIAYAENILNLSIAAVYPICLLAMSGELRRFCISK